MFIVVIDVGLNKWRFNISWLIINNIFNVFKGKRFYFFGNGRKSKDIGIFICRVGSVVGFILIIIIVKLIYVFMLVFSLSNWFCGCFLFKEKILEILISGFIVSF